MAVTTSAATTCAGCVFGALSSTLLSYTSHVIETIDITIIPHVTVFPNGSRTTSTEYITRTEDLVLPSGTGAFGASSSATATTYTNTADITWTIDDAILTYGTTYVRYLGFAGAPATSDSNQLCAQQTDATTVELPASTDVASLIYPLPANATAATAIPAQLLEYLDSFPAVASQFSGESLSACAPLTAMSSVSSALERRAVLASVVKAETKRFEGARTAAAGQYPIMTPKAYPAPNGTLWRRDDGYGTGTGTAIIGTGPAEPLTTALPAQSSSAVVTEASSVLETNTHTTAYVINTITGRAIVTSQSGPSSASPAKVTTQQDTSPTVQVHSPTSVINSGGGSGENLGGGGEGTADNTSPAPGNGGSGGSNGRQTSNGNTPSPAPTGNSGNDGTGSNGNSGSGQDSAPAPGTAQEAPPAAQDNTPTSTGSGADISNLVGQIQTAAKQGSSPTIAPGVNNEDGTQGISNILGNIGSVAAAQTGNGAGSGSQPSYVENQATPQVTGDSGPNPAASPVFSVGSTAVSTGSDGAYYYGTQSLTPGSTIMVGSGHAYTAVVLQTTAGSTQLVVGGKTISGLPSSGQTAATPSGDHTAVITAEGQTFTAIQSGDSVIYADGSSTLTVASGSSATFEGQVVSAAPAGNGIVIGGSSTVAFATPSDAASQLVITTDGHTFTVIETGGSVILEDASSSATLSAGSVTTFDGQVISAPSPAGSLIVNGQTITSSSPQSTTGATEAVITAGGQSFTAVQISGGSVILEDATSTITVKDGSVATFEGQIVDIASDGAAVIVDGSSTIKLSGSATSTSTGLGDYVHSGLVGGGATASSTAEGASASSTSDGTRSSALSLGVYVCACLMYVL